LQLLLFVTGIFGDFGVNVRIDLTKDERFYRKRAIFNAGKNLLYKLWLSEGKVKVEVLKIY